MMEQKHKKLVENLNEIEREFYKLLAENTSYQWQLGHRGFNDARELYDYYIDWWKEMTGEQTHSSIRRAIE